MGAGHYWDREAETMHLSWLDLVDYDDYPDEELHWILHQEAWDDVKHTINTCLPPSFSECQVWDDDTPCWIVAMSGLHKVMIHDNDTCLYIVVKPRNDLMDAEGRAWDGLATANLHRTAAALWKRLSDHYPLYVRDTAWTSKRYES